jgi:hypothetical protein
LNKSTTQIIRFILGLSWIYQGFFPKLFVIAPLERQLTSTMGFSADISDAITRGAGISEVFFGVLLIVFYQNRTIHILNISALLALLFYVMLMMPVLLIEAFNPVTSNIALIGLSVALLDHIRVKAGEDG